MGEAVAVDERLLCLLMLSSFSLCVILCRVPGTRPIAAPCLPLRIFPMRMISARSLARHLQPLEIPYPGICPNTSGPKERSTGVPCWTLPRGLCFGSQVRAGGRRARSRPSRESHLLRPHQLLGGSSRISWPRFVLQEGEEDAHVYFKPEGATCPACW